jgi:putative restriction endonuclease
MTEVAGVDGCRAGWVTAVDFPIRLLEAAHIIPDTEPGGEPIVPNGLSLCRLHHGAFDTYLLGIRPDYTVEVRRSVLEETDGPMLRHGLQGVHNQRIWTPRSANLKPARDLLERRYERFLKAG